MNNLSRVLSGGMEYRQNCYGITCTSINQNIVLMHYQFTGAFYTSGFAHFWKGQEKAGMFLKEPIHITSGSSVMFSNEGINLLTIFNGLRRPDELHNGNPSGLLPIEALNAAI